MSASIGQLQEGFRQRVEDWLADLREQGIHYNVTSTRRSTAEQKRLYARYLAGESALPAAPPGSSMHERGRAVDVAFESDEEWDYAIDTAAQLDIAWAGERDPVHFEDANRGLEFVPPEEDQEISTGEKVRRMIFGTPGFASDTPFGEASTVLKKIYCHYFC